MCTGRDSPYPYRIRVQAVRGCVGVDPSNNCLGIVRLGREWTVSKPLQPMIYSFRAPCGQCERRSGTMVLTESR